MGENEHRTDLVHGRKAGVLLRGTALLRWIEDGQQKWIYERVTAVSVRGVRLVAVYQPVWMTDEVGLERCRRDLESQLSMCRNERLLIGGDWNANVGRGSARNGVCGEFGVGRMNDAGRDLIEWCEANGLTYANSFVRHAERGTWFNRMYGRWYELDGFVVRQNERHRMIRRMKCEYMNELSNHKPKKVVICVEKRRWRAVNGERKRRIKWEMLRDSEKKAEYKESTRVKWNERMERETGESSRMQWKNLVEVMNEAAEEVCGLESGRVANPWHEREMNGMGEQIERLISDRNSMQERINARRLRARRGGGELARLEREWVAVKEQLGRARRNMRQFLRRVEREWWHERIEECENACNLGRMGEMFKILKEIGRKEWKAPPSVGITVEEFKEHFEKVSEMRYEVDPAVIGEVRDLRGCEKAREANECMNGELVREEIEEAMKEMRDSAPGEDGIRMCYLKENV